MKIGVSGASGQLGKAVVEHLIARSGTNSVVGISRSPETIRNEIERRHGDYDDPATLLDAYAGLDRLLIIPTLDIRWGARSRQLVAAIDAATAARVGQIVLMSDVIPTSVDGDSRWDSQGADFLIRCSEQEESRDGSSDWGTNGLHFGGFASFSAAMC